jgi:hypothetical protein
MHCWMRFLLVQSALLLAVITNWQSRDDLQLFRFVDFKNNAVFEPRIYEGIDAERIDQIL